MSYPKFNNLDVVWDLPENCVEWDHIVVVLNRLENYLVPLRFAERFVFYITPQSKKLDIATDLPVVVYQVNDKDHKIPDYLNKAFAVFRNYVPFAPFPHSVYNLPLGCNKNISSLEIQPMVDRSIDLFFMGQADNREDFFSSMEKDFLLEPNNKNIIIKQFAEIQYNVYAHNMAQTKLALCPSGKSYDTHRIYEAMRAGCVVVAPRQSPTWFNIGWPVVELDDWSELKPIADSLLADEEKLQEISNKTHLWWEEKCSEEAVARYMASELSLRLMKYEI